MKTNLLKTAIAAVLIMVSTKMMAYTAVASGAWSSAATWGGMAPGGNVNNNDIIIPNGLTVTLDMDVTFSGLLNSFTVNGSLTSSTNNNVWISTGAFAGSGTVNIHRLSFNGALSTSSFSGNLSLNDFQNQGSVLTLGAMVTIYDTLDLDGGSIVLSSGSNITMMTNSNVRVNNGTLTSAGGLFTTSGAYDVFYVGTSKNTGLELNSNSLQNIHINMIDTTQTVNQGSNNVIVHGYFHMLTGEYNLNNYQLTLGGDLLLGTGSRFSSSGNSNLIIQGTGSMTSGLFFTSGSSLTNLTIDRAGSFVNIDLMSSLSITGILHLADATFRVRNGAMLIMNSGSTVQIGDGTLQENNGTFVGTAAYNVQYIGGQQQAGVELYASGLNNVTVSVTSPTDTVEMENNVTVHGSLTLISGLFSLYGHHLTLDGSLHQMPSAPIVGDSASDLILNLTTTSTDTIYFGGIQHIRNMTLNIPSSSMLLIATDLILHNQLTMASGKIELTNSHLILRSAAYISNYSDTKYIVTSGSGQLEMNVNSNSVYVTFPVGTAAHYSPAQIQQTSTGSSGMFMVRAMDGVYTMGTTGYNSAITESMVNKTWVIDAAGSVNVNMNLKLGWVAADEVNGFNRTQAYISHFMNSNWDSHAASAAVSGANNTYEILRAGITSLSPFAVVDTSAELSTQDITAESSISIYPNPSIDYVTVQNGNGNKNYLYEVYDAAGQLVYSVSNSNSINKINLSEFVNGLYFIKITDTTTHMTITKQVVKQ